MSAAIFHRQTNVQILKNILEFKNGGTVTAGASSVITLPNVTDTLVGKATSDVFTNKTFDVDGTGNSLTNIANANIKAAAGIAYSKLTLTGSVVNADISASAAIAYSKLALTGSILNADINASAAIAYSKLNLTGTILNADINASAAIAYSKLNLTTSIVNGDVSASAAIAYSKLNLALGIVNGDINAGAAIAFSKLAGLTVSRALVSDASGIVSVASTTLAEIGYLNGLANTNGGLVYGNGTGIRTTSAGTSQMWALSAGAAAPTFSNTTTTGKFVDGSADEIQMRVQANGTQTADIVSVENNSGSSLLAVTLSNGTKIRGTTTNDNAATSFVGEYVEVTNTSSDTSFPTSAQYGGDNTISLTAGDWDLSLTVYVTKNGATVSANPDIFIGTVTGNDTTGRALGSNFALVPFALNDTGTANIANYRQSISATTSYYLKIRASYSVATPQYRYRLSARRVR